MNETKPTVIFLPGGDKVALRIMPDQDGRKFYVFTRAGYPPMVRRRLYDAHELERAYTNDAVCKLRGKTK